MIPWFRKYKLQVPILAIIRANLAIFTNNFTAQENPDRQRPVVVYLVCSFVPLYC